MNLIKWLFGREHLPRGPVSTGRDDVSQEGKGRMEVGGSVVAEVVATEKERGDPTRDTH